MNTFVNCTFRIKDIKFPFNHFDNLYTFFLEFSKLTILKFYLF